MAEDRATLYPLSAIVCDDIRIELNRKEFFIGVYSADLVIFKTPISLNLAVHLLTETRGPKGLVPVELEIEPPGGMSKIAAKGVLEVSGATKANQQLGLSFPPLLVSIPRDGDLIVRFRQYDEDWKIVKVLPVVVGQRPQEATSATVAERPS
jgi:hypothetical protein